MFVDYRGNCFFLGWFTELYNVYYIAQWYTFYINKNTIGCLAKHLAFAFLNCIISVCYKVRCRQVKHLLFTERSNENKSGVLGWILCIWHGAMIFHYIKHLIFDNYVTTEMLTNSNIQGYKQLNCFQHTRQKINNDCVHIYCEMLC